MSRSERDKRNKEAAIFRRQLGLITLDQARHNGRSRHEISRLLVGGQWIRVFRGVYRLAASAETWHQNVLAACLWAGEGSAASHRAAAVVWGLDGFERAPTEITTHRSLCVPKGSVIVHRRPSISEQITRHAGIPVIRVDRTLLDLGAVAPAEQVELALEDALRRRLTAVPRLVQLLEHVSTNGTRGSATLRKLLHQRSGSVPPTESALETRFVQTLRRAGLPPPQRQHRIYFQGRLVARVDFAYPDVKVAVEVDSRRHHSSPNDWQRDLARRNLITAAGWAVFHMTMDDMRQCASERAHAIAHLCRERRAHSD